ncbi:ArnT family glycosyltransferase [Terriglobus roseus]|uniref:ArnT family glycosyltransferase n=1 Tax=Terriglobus roseus TaxID=392734 RepID=UPI001FCE15F6|nr:glycosyltransferase family 39 protein [Terriglobus roseus]
MLLAVVTLLVQVLPYLSYRWVTDESWYTGPGYSLAHGHGVADPAIGPNDIENHFDARPPGTAIVISGVFRMLGVGQVQARLGSVVAAIIVLLAVYRIGLDVLGRNGAIVAVLVAATDNFLVASARTARPEALTTMAVMLSLWAMVRYARSPQMLWAFASGILIALAAMFHITVLGFVISFGLLAIVIDHRGGRFPLRGALLYTAGFAAGLGPFVAWILTSPLGKKGFRAEYLARTHEGQMLKLAHECKRYADMLGLHQLHGGLEWVPVRILIPACFLAATFLLWRYRRTWFWLELLLFVPTVFWFIETANKSSRYFALTAPFTALVIGACVAITLSQQRWRKPVLYAAGLLIAMQFGSNLLLLRAASHANYNKVAAELNSVVPAGEPVYGTITFWLAMHDHTYLSYERTTPRMAQEQFGVHYFVLGDRMMTQGEPWDAEFYEDMNQYLADLVQRSTLVGNFPDPYYGDLKVYRTQ